MNKYTLIVLAALSLTLLSGKTFADSWCGGCSWNTVSCGCCCNNYDSGYYNYGYGYFPDYYGYGYYGW